MNLRLKLTLFSALVSALILTLGGLVLFAALRESLRWSFDDALRETAQLAISQLGGHEGDPRLETEGLRFEARLPGATALTIYDRQRRPIDHYGNFRVSAPLAPGFASLGEMRVYTEALPGGGFIQAARSQVELGRTLVRAGRLVLLVLPVLLLVSLGAGYGLADRALRPVDQVTRLAEKIATSGRSRERVPSAPGSDEMARLTRTVNAMLERLERTIERERAFALAAAHELRTPLAAMLGRTSLTLERNREASAYREALQEADEIARQMSATVDTLLALARSNQSTKRQALDLADLAFEGLLALQLRAQARGVTLEPALESAELRGDPSNLRLAITNLLENAVKYGRESGHVWVRTGSDGQRAWLEVSDDGPGVPEADLDRLQQPFQRGEAFQHLSGAGLGLALVGAVMEGHGGRLVLGRASEGGLSARLEFECTPDDRMLCRQKRTDNVPQDNFGIS